MKKVDCLSSGSWLGEESVRTVNRIRQRAKREERKPFLDHPSFRGSQSEFQIPKPTDQNQIEVNHTECKDLKPRNTRKNAVLPWLFAYFAYSAVNIRVSSFMLRLLCQVPTFSQNPFGP